MSLIGSAKAHCVVLINIRARTLRCRFKGNTKRETASKACLELPPPNKNHRRSFISDEHHCLEQTSILASILRLPFSARRNQRCALKNCVLGSDHGTIRSPPPQGREVRSPSCLVRVAKPIDECFFFETTSVSTVVFEKSGVAPFHH